MENKREEIDLQGLKLVKETPPVPSKKYPILFIHGMCGGALLWDNYMRFFSARGYVCYAINLRGHHGSRPVRNIGKVSLRDYLQDIEDVIKVLGNPVIIAHSMGTLLTQKIIERYTLPGVILLCPVGTREIVTITTPEMVKATIKNIFKLILGLPLLPDKRTIIITQLNKLPPHTQEIICSRFVPESGRALFQILFPGLHVDASKIHTPMLIVGGSEDVTVPPAITLKVAQKYKADFREYQGVGHMPHWESCWRDIAQDIAEWLERKGCS